MTESRDARLHPGRLARCLAAMSAAGVDVLLLSRAANVRHASGARRVWTAGSRPFAPWCVVVGAGAAVHLLGVGDAGVPAHVPARHRHPVRWDPAGVAAVIAGLPGVAGARRVGVDGITPAWRRLLATALPGAALVDGDAVIGRARAVKDPGELAALAEAERLAAAAADRGLAAAAGGGRAAGVAAAVEAVVEAGGLPAFTPRTGPDGGWLEVGALVDGYEGDAAAAARPEAAEAVVEVLCERLGPGAGLAELRAAHRDAGGADPGAPFLHGLGLGLEPPLAGPVALAGEAETGLAVGMVVALRCRAGTGLARRTAVITSHGWVPLATAAVEGGGG